MTDVGGFHVPTLSVSGGGGSVRGGASASLLLVSNTHASRSSHQTSADSEIRK